MNPKVSLLGQGVSHTRLAIWAEFLRAVQGGGCMGTIKLCARLGPPLIQGGEAQGRAHGWALPWASFKGVQSLAEPTGAIDKPTRNTAPFLTPFKGSAGHWEDTLSG